MTLNKQAFNDKMNHAMNQACACEHRYENSSSWDSKTLVAYVLWVLVPLFVELIREIRGIRQEMRRRAA